MLRTALLRPSTTPILLNRLPGEATSHPEQKDPSFIERVREDYLNDPVTPYRYIGYTSSGESVNQHWKVARYGTNDLRGPWQELESPTLIGLSGPQLCAPALRYEFEDGQPRYSLYIQTACFEPGGVIMEADSRTGRHSEVSRSPWSRRTPSRQNGRSSASTTPATRGLPWMAGCTTA